MASFVKFIEFDNGNPGRDLFHGSLEVSKTVERCPYCERLPVYCFPFLDLTDIEIYCDYCGIGRHSHDICEAVDRWNDFCRSERWLRHLQENENESE